MHSGAVCPGLIEAHARPNDIGPLGQRIPGQSAPASLKHGDRERQFIDTACIPGQSAPASLKRGFLPTHSPAHSLHSGAVCPGLIEASLLYSISEIR